jgi:hypothetical protein
MDNARTFAGTISKVTLNEASFPADADVTGTVEVNVPRGKEISSVLLELSSWRHIHLKKTDKSHVEQLTRQTLELFPNIEIGGAGRNGHDTKTLRDTAIFTFRFGALEPTKAPTMEAFSAGRIKHYMTCFVHKRAGLLNREKQLEKNQFQIPITAPILEVDALFPDRTFTSLEARPNSANPEDYGLRVRCNTHLLSGLPFLIECDLASHASARSITLSLHQRAFASIGKDEEESSYRSLYVHEVSKPQSVRDGHFRGKNSARPLAHGREVYLIEWQCPRRDSRARLPFRETLYAKTAEANLECGLSMRVEIDLETGERLVSVIHGITYASDWVDARPERQQHSLRHERSINPDAHSPAGSVMTQRRLSTTSSQSDLRTSPGFAPPNFASFQRRQQQQGPASHMRQPSNASALGAINLGGSEGYFERQRAQRASSRGGYSPNIQSEENPVLTHGSLGPSARPAMGYGAGQNGSPLLRSSPAMNLVTGQDTIPRHSPNRPEQITLPPANVRASMSLAFEHMNLAGGNRSTTPVSARSNPSSQAARSPRSIAIENVGMAGLPVGTPPPPSQPLPRPPSNGNGSAGLAGLGLFHANGSRPTSSQQQHLASLSGGNGLVHLASATGSMSSLVSPVQGNGLEDRPISRMSSRANTSGVAQRAIRPHVVLGVSQSTVQTMQSREDGVAAQSLVNGESPVVPPFSSTLSSSSTMGGATSLAPEYYTGPTGDAFDVATRVTSPVHESAIRTSTTSSPKPGQSPLIGHGAAGTVGGLVQGFLASKRVSDSMDSQNSMRDSGYAASGVVMSSGFAGQRGTPQRSGHQAQAQTQQQTQQQNQVQQEQGGAQPNGNEILLG